jgi:hypothetical protein
MENNAQDIGTPLARILGMVLGLPWFEIAGTIWKIGRKLMRGLSNEGVYDVLDYECILELKDTEGRNATIHKTEKVRYLQDYITTYQDQAWGSGNIFLDYKCSPGIPVDEYQTGQNTYKLISLREVKNKGDIDKFNIEWKMKNGFLKSVSSWGTAINQRTKKVTIKVIFPKERPPQRISIFESNLQRTLVLGAEALQILPDGRSMVVWEKGNPRLYEDYILSWEW